MSEDKCSECGGTYIHSWRLLKQTNGGFQIRMDKNFKIKFEITNGKGLRVESEVSEDELYDIVKSLDQARVLLSANRILNDLNKK